MQTILSAALIFALGGVAGEKVELAGTWKCEYEVGGQKRESTLSIKKDGDKLAGSMTWPDQKETNLKDLKLKDNTLTFSVLRKFPDNSEATVQYKLAFDGDKFKGRVAAEIRDRKLEFDIYGTREKKDK